MPNFVVPPESWTDAILPNGRPEVLISKEGFERFSPEALGLGNLTTDAKEIDTIAAMFDLEGFTNFCKQIEPRLSVPLFLSSFLDWLMTNLRDEMRNKEHPEGIELWCPLPYFVKFMGDGLLVLWDSTDMPPVARRNVIVSCKIISLNYESTFLPAMRSKVSVTPPRLRCGVARGTVFSVGDSNDYVGPCINMAARIQKLSSLTFTFNRRGFDLEAPDADVFFREVTSIKAVTIRGVGEDELIGVDKTEFESLPVEQQAQFRDP
jgi:class 3 adenylate cyclase